MCYGHEIKQDVSGNHRGLFFYPLAKRRGELAGRYKTSEIPTKKIFLYAWSGDNSAVGGKINMMVVKSLLRYYIRVEIFLG